MPDHARSSDPAVQTQLDRLAALSPGRDILGLERIAELCARLGNPQNQLPRTFHVAGTNGKGSTCAYLRAILEAQGRRVHSYTSPHLVRFNERIRLAGTLIDNTLLAALLEEVLDVAADLRASFFEITTAAALLAFARIPADDCIIEVGLGGRLDATNIIPPPAVCGIASLGIDHEAFLLAPEDGTPDDPAVRIAWEKAGIFKPGAALATLAYPEPLMQIISERAVTVGGTLFSEGDTWRVDAAGDGFHWRSEFGSIEAPLHTRMPGAHQHRNAGLAITMLSIAPHPRPREAEVVQGIANAFWPGRMQRLNKGPLTARLPADRDLWVDGGHNLDAARELAKLLAGSLARDQKIDVVLGMLANKDAAGFLTLLVPHIARVAAVPIAGHEHHSPAALAEIARQAGIANAMVASDIGAAIDDLAANNPAPATLIGGSLYLVGQALDLNAQLPV
jgi:dihydrofolate synthase / folylpolyglutamate synthase